MKASNTFVRALENEGVEYIFTVPGEETLDLIDSIRQSETIQLIVTRHEQGAGFMAATYGRLTGKPGVCLVTLGPGVTNIMTSVAYAQLGAMPMIVITGQKPIKKHKQGRFQVIDAVSMMNPITKMSRQIVNVRNIPILVRDEFQIKADQAIRANKKEYDQSKLKRLLEDKLTAAISNIKNRCKINEQADKIDDTLGDFFNAMVMKYAKQVDYGATDEQIRLNIQKSLDDAKKEISRKKYGNHTADELRKILKRCFLRKQNDFSRKKEHIRTSEKIHRRAGLWATWVTVTFIIVPMAVLP